MINTDVYVNITTGETAQKAGDNAEDMAMEMLATTMGLPNDPS